MERRLLVLACLAVAAVAGCRGCSEEQDPPAAAAAEAVRSEQTERARLLSRMSARKLDRAKAYPRDADGSVRCDRDIDCFIVQAEGCKRASLLHEQSISGYGLTQIVQAHYRITGSEVGRCKFEREVLMLDAKLDPAMADALRKGGKTDAEIEAIRTDGIDALRRRNPPRLECFLTPDQALEASLNLAEGRYNPVHWRTACRERPGKPPQIGNAAPSAPGPAAPAAPKADVPVPKQP